MYTHSGDNMEYTEVFEHTTGKEPILCCLWGLVARYISNYDVDT